MKIRLNTVPTKFLVGDKHMAALAWVVTVSGPSEVPKTISSGKHDTDNTVMCKAVGFVLNGHRYTLRNKTLGAERISRV